MERSEVKKSENNKGNKEWTNDNFSKEAIATYFVFNSFIHTVFNVLKISSDMANVIFFIILKNIGIEALCVFSHKQKSPLKSHWHTKAAERGCIKEHVEQMECWCSKTGLVSNECPFISGTYYSWPLESGAEAQCESEALEEFL